MLRVPMLDLAAQFAPLRERLLSAVTRVAESQHFLLGAEVEAFERKAAVFLGVPHAVGVSSGSDALVAALLALGVGPGDEVVTTPFSFFASVESILRVGAVPKFADLEPGRFDLDPRAAEAAIGPRTRSILVVHLYGHPARARELASLAERRGIALVEDAAQVFGARQGGTAAGAFGGLGCFSFQPTKPLGAWGDAGLVVTGDAELAERLARIRAHGASGKHRHALVGGNYRLDALQAAVLGEKLDELPGWLRARAEHAAAYAAAFSEIDGVVLPAVDDGAEPSWALYTLRVRDGRRDALRDFLAERGVESAVHYPAPLHRQPALLERGFGAPEEAFPEAARAAREVLSLPIYAELTAAGRQAVIDGVRVFFGRQQG